MYIYIYIYTHNYILSDPKSNGISPECRCGRPTARPGLPVLVTGASPAAGPYLLTLLGHRRHRSFLGPINLCLNKGEIVIYVIYVI